MQRFLDVLRLSCLLLVEGPVEYSRSSWFVHKMHHMFWDYLKSIVFFSFLCLCICLFWDYLKDILFFVFLSVLRYCVLCPLLLVEEHWSSTWLVFPSLWCLQQRFPNFPNRLVFFHCYIAKLENIPQNVHHTSYIEPRV